MPADYVSGRRRLVEELRRELVGPSPGPTDLDTQRPIVFSSWAEARQSFRELGSGEEILSQDSPTNRYGVGVLYPARVQAPPEAREDAGESQASLGLVEADGSPPEERLLEAQALTALDKAAQEMEPSMGGDTDDFDLTTAHSFRPGSLAVSFLAQLRQGEIEVLAGGGRYDRLRVIVEGRDRIWWVRRPVALRAQVNLSSLPTDTTKLLTLPVSGTPTGDLKLTLEMYCRPRGPETWLITACLVNRSDGTELNADRCLFQSQLDIFVPSSHGAVLSYPGPPRESLDDEDRSNELIYRDHRTFAVGHGCSADWEVSVDRTVHHVRSEVLPAVSVPSISADAVDADGHAVEVSMAKLAGLIDGQDGSVDLEALVLAYGRWIETRGQEVASLPVEHAEAARTHLERCRHALDRMRAGVRMLSTDPITMRAFRLANHAILIQQLRYRRQSRAVAYDPKEATLSYSAAAPDPDPTIEHVGLGKWRAFQIAFLLAALPSVDSWDDRDREVVELIWFPTGGGKTEAYLALAAFAMARRRLRNRRDSGLEVLMRYTLRLLTAQQFQRAAAMVVALEWLRRGAREELGDDPFTIGIWVGGDTTPLTRSDALKAAKNLIRSGVDVENPFLILRCPWCSAQMGPVKLAGKGAPKTLGYTPDGSRVRFDCPDHDCDFHDELPILVVDEDIYETPPSMLIATVDKFAMLAWRPDARSLFGIGSDGERMSSPPGLIIQDELHLISGPLGSMVGLYETVIEDLCTDRRAGRSVRPKIVSSTATIRNYGEQVRSLYARKEVVLFPPPGLTISDSFFARQVEDEDGSHSKLYVGIHAPGLNSLQTVQVRVYTSLLQAASRLPEAERDPWWTLVCFYNSLRELGGGVSLFQTDIPDYTRVIRDREVLPSVRFIRRPLELTGRISNDEVPRIMAALEVPYDAAGEPAIDVCLASSMLEVGIDIDRLSLMAVVGQPKTTSQYIQVTGRVGRRWWERPGLVVTLYSASKPRDRSHFEQFRSYHERLYAQVEPTSVTPFSPSALMRALHAVVSAFCRQRGDSGIAECPHPYPEGLIREVGRILEARANLVDPDEATRLLEVLARRSKEWQQWQPVRWSSAHGTQGQDPPLLVAAGSYVPPQWLGLSWSTPQSLRTVDSECQAAITTHYLTAQDDDATTGS